MRLDTRTVQIKADYDHTYTLKTNKKIHYWDNNENNALDYANNNSINDDETPIIIPNVKLTEPTTSIVTNHDFTCALLKSKTVNYWENNTDEHLDNDNEHNVDNDEEPTTIEPISPFD